MLNFKNRNLSLALFAAIFILSSGIATAYAAPTSEPTLKLVKSVITDDGGTAVADSWDLFATAESGSEIFFNLGGSGVFEQVPASTAIILSESEGPGGYSTGTMWSCDGGIFTEPNKITLSDGDKVTCTTTSDDDAPSITLVNKVQNDNGGTVTADAWTLSATAPKSASARNISGTGTLADDQTASIESSVFANAGYALGSEGPSGYIALNDGRWACTITFPNGFAFNVGKASSLNLKEGDSAVCTITHDDEAQSLSVSTPTKAKGKYTVSAELTGFSSVPVGFTINNMNSLEAAASSETIVDEAPYSYSIPAKDLEAGATYSITVIVYDGSENPMTETVEMTIPAKGNTK
jgi:hypothetical protein